MKSKAMKKLVVFLTVATMVFGMVGSAFAAVNTDASAFADVSASDDAATAFNVLASLGIYQGNEGVGGNVRPDSTITREEFSAVVVRLIGREKTAQSLNTYVPSFTDANSISSWAWGYVNVASSLGIINGYPSGDFRPSNPVTHAEALAMLSRAVEVDKAAKGQWPLNFVLLGTEVGLSDDVDIVANVPATRAEIAVMTYNAFNVDQEWDADNEELVDRAGGATYGSEERENQVSGTVNSVSTSAINIDGDSYDFADNAYVSGVSNLNDLVEMDVEAYLNSDDEVVAVVVVDDADLVGGEVGDIDSTDGSVSIEVGDTEYEDFVNAVSLYINNDAQTVNDADANGNADEVAAAIDALTSDRDIMANVSVNDDGDVESIRVTYVDVTGFLTAVTNDDDDTDVTVDGNVVDITDDTIISLNGEAATLDDIEAALDAMDDDYSADAYALVTTEGAVGNGADAIKLAVYTETIEGEVVGSGVSGSSEYVTLEVDGDDVKVVLSGDANSNTTDRTAITGTVTLLLNDENESVDTLSAAGDETFYAQLQGWVENEDGDVTDVSLQLTSDSTVDYELESGYQDTAANLAIAADTAYLVQTNTAGEITSIAAVQTAAATATTVDYDNGNISKVTSTYITADAGTLPLASQVYVEDADGDVADLSDVDSDWDDVNVRVDSDGAIIYIKAN